MSTPIQATREFNSSFHLFDSSKGNKSEENYDSEPFTTIDCLEDEEISGSGNDGDDDEEIDEWDDEYDNDGDNEEESDESNNEYDDELDDDEETKTRKIKQQLDDVRKLKHLEYGKTISTEIEYALHKVCRRVSFQIMCNHKSLILKKQTHLYFQEIHRSHHGKMVRRHGLRVHA